MTPQSLEPLDAQPKIDRQPPARLVALLGAKGGCGTTTLAIDLAATIAEGSTDRVVLIDFDFCKGDVGGFLDLQPVTSLHDLLESHATIDSSLVRGCALRYPSGGFDVLAQPRDLADLDQLSHEDAAPILTAARHAWDRVVVDCGSRIDPATLSAVVQADEVILVLTPDLASLADAHRVLDLIRRLGVPREKQRIVLNKHSGRSPFHPVDVQEQLGLPMPIAIPRDDIACAAALLEGKRISDVAPQSAISRQLRHAWHADDEDTVVDHTLPWRLPWMRRG